MNYSSRSNYENRSAASKRFAVGWTSIPQKEELDAVPGIGKAYSQKIIAARPCRAKADLVRKRMIPQATTTKSKTR